MAAAAASLFSFVSIFRHDHFASYGFDLGIFDQTIWGYSRGAVLENTVKRTPNLLGDHFHPLLIALAPLYWLWDDVRVLLIAQGALVAAASLPIFYWARLQLGTWFACSVQLAFLGFWGVLAGTLFDFHEIAVAVPIVALALYALLTRRNLLFWLALGLGCLVKEDVPLTFAAIGLYAAIVQRRWRIGLAAAGVSLIWFAVLTTLVMPALAAAPYGYWAYPELGASPMGAVWTLLKEPWLAVELFVDRWEKIRTLIYLFAAWLALPIASPLTLIALPSLAERFWSDNESHWSPYFQYSLLTAPVLAFAAVDAVVRVRRLLRVRLQRVFVAVISVALVIAGAYMTVMEVRPLAPLETYRSGARAAEMNACLDGIPASASVAASNTLVPHLTHRESIYPLFARAGQEYLAIDTATRAGQRARDMLSRAQTRPAYKAVCATRDVVVYRSAGRS